MTRYAEIKRSRSKVSAAYRRGSTALRSIAINVEIQRNFSYGAVGYRAEACIKKRGRMGRLRCALSTGSAGTTPTRAVKSAVNNLMKKVK